MSQHAITPGSWFGTSRPGVSREAGSAGRDAPMTGRHTGAAKELQTRVAAPEWRLANTITLRRPALQVVATEMMSQTRPGPWRVQLEHTSAGLFLFEITSDGVVSVFWRHGQLRLTDAGAVPVFALPVIAAHPGAGASTWAAALKGVETTVPVEGALVVARSTLDGITSAKRFSASAGAVLLVADGPGKPSTEVARAVRVLAGAAPVIPVPWIPALQRSAAATETPAFKKVAASLATTVQQQWRNP